MSLLYLNLMLYFILPLEQLNGKSFFNGLVRLHQMKSCFYALHGSDVVIRSLEDAKTVAAIGVVKDDARHQMLVQNNVTNLKLYPTDVECYKALSSGEVELVMGSTVTMAMMAGQAGVESTLELKPGLVP